MNKNGLGDYADVAFRVAAKYFPDDAVLATQRIHKMINGSPAAAVKLLEAELRKHPDNAVMVNTLGNAYVNIRNRQKFERIADQIDILELRDYLEAKLYYFENSGQKAMRLLEPHIQNIDKCSNNILGLYMACIPDEHVLHAIIQELHGDGFYQHLLKCRDEWRKNPMRMELSAKGYAHAQNFYELGGNPISFADRKKAGMGFEVPVHVRGVSTLDHN